MNVREPVDLLVVQAARGLVEQQQPRLRDERARELDALERPEREARRRTARDVGDPDVLERLVRASRERFARDSKRETVWAPTSTFSSTVIVGKSSTFWKVRAMPRRTTRLGGVCSSDLPSKTTSPASSR